MVLIPESNPHAPTSRHSDAASGSISHSADSFDNIEQVLEDTPVSPDFLDPTNITEHRWRFPRDANPDTTSTVDLAPLPSNVDTVSASTHLLKRFFLVGGGVALGTLLAVGLSFGLLRDSDDPNATSQEPDTAQVFAENDAGGNERPEIVDYVVNAKDGITVDQGTADTQLDEAQVAVIEPDDIVPLAKDDVLPAASAPADPTPLDPQSAPESTEQATDENVANDELVTNGVIPDLFTDQDDLTDFANWLRVSPIQPKVSSNQEPTPTEIPVSEPIDVVQIQQTRPSPPLVNVDVRLHDRISAIKLQSTNLSSVLRFLTDYSTIPISFDPDALAFKNISPSKPFGSELDNKVFSNVNVETILQKVLDKIKLDYVKSEGHILITTRSVKNKRSSRYSHQAADIASTNADLQKLFDLVQRFVSPEVWVANGGTAEIAIKDGAIEVTHTDLTHFRVLRFLDRLRIASNLSPSRANVFTVTPRLEQGKNRGSELVSLRSARPMSFAEIAQEVEKQIPELNILVDWQSLHAAGWSPKDTVDFFCDNRTVSDALNSLLIGKGLAWRVIDEWTFEISSQMSILQANEIEIYPIKRGDLQNLQQKINQLAIRYPIANIEIEGSWSDEFLLLSAPQPVHREMLDTD